SIVAIFCAGVVACQHDDQPAAQYPQPYPQQYPPQQYQYPGQPGAPAPQALPPQSTLPAAPGAVATIAPQLPPGPDPINTTNLTFLRAEASSVMRELITNLPPLQQGRVANVPIVVDSTPGDVNAFATCTQDGKAAMAVTDGLFDIQAHLARAKAYDE